MLRHWLIIISLCLLGSLSAEANVLDYRYQKAFRVQALSIEDGLSQSVVNNIVQDSQGFVWIATEDGLNRFDGYEFRVYQQNHNDPESLHDNYVLSLAVEKEKGLWIGTTNGPTFLDFKSDKFIKYWNGNSDLKTETRAVAVTSATVVFAGTDNGLFWLDKQTDQFKLFTSDKGLSIDDEIQSLEVLGNKLWVATHSCVYEIALSNFQLTTLCNAEFTQWLGEGVINAVRFRDDNLWIGTTVGLGKLDRLSNNFESFRNVPGDNKSLISNWIQEIAVDQSGDLWIATAYGLSVYRYNENAFEQYQHIAQDKEGLSANDILTVSVDSTGLIWLGTYAAGINILNPARTNFTHVLSKSDVVPFNGKNTIHGITKDMDENLWMADFGGGLYKLDLMTGEVSRPFQDSPPEYREVIEYAYTLLVDVNNRLWIGAFEGLVLVDLNSHEILPTRFILNNQSIKFNDRVYQIYEDHSGTIWIATMEGLYVVESLNEEQGELVLSLIGKQPEIPHSYRDRSSRVSAILETRDGTLWIGGPSGLLSYSPKKDQWRHFEYHADNKQSLSNDDVQVIFEDSRGILWVGTGNGLNKVHRSSQDEIYFERITKEHGLPNNAIYGILEDNYKQLWLSTNLGLVKYSGQVEGMQSFRRYDGLSSDEFNTAAYYADSDGLLYFGSINGVTVVDSRVTTDLPKERKLLFTRIQIGKRSLDVYALNHAPKPQIRMNKEESTIKISVADLFYQKLNTQSYRYRLLGLDDSWVSLGKERTFFLAGLKEGRYILDIQSKVGNEDWSENNLRVELNVYADFLKSENMYYMVMLFSALFVFTVLFWIKRNYEQRINKAENLVKIESVRLKEAKKQIDELKVDLENKAGELNLITDKFNDSSKLLDSYQFRDEISGFYRYQKMRNLFLQQYFGEKEKPAGFNLIAVLQLNGLEKVAEQFGQVAAAEVVSHASSELKSYSPAHIHICALKNDSFVILANTIENNDFINTLVNLRKKLIQSKISIANNASVSIQVGMSYLDLFPKAIADSSQLVNLCEILIASHRSLNHIDISGLMRIDLNCGVEELDYLTSASEIVKLIEGNTVTYHFID